MKFRELLKGKTPSAQQAIDAFFSNINEERILWYPSAGFDYRDVLEMRSERLQLHEIPESANIICHTDYCFDWTKLDQRSTPIPIHINKRTKVDVIEKHPLILSPGNNINFILTLNIYQSQLTPNYRRYFY